MMSQGPFAFGEPTDPAYLAFRDGLARANDDVGDLWRWRWSPRHEGWFTYSLEKWILEDVGVADTPGPALAQADDPDVERARMSLFLPPVFQRMQEAYARHRTRWPDLVWSWHGGGDWRNAIARNPDASDPDTGGGPVDDGLTQECKAQIADVRAFEARGDITPAQARQMIARIVERCAVGPG